MGVHFECTACGKCCHNLRLPLSVDEARAWIRRGGEVQILCEAFPWADEPAATDLAAQFRKQRSFSVTSAALPARMQVTLVAYFDGACPYLGADLRCGAYEERPRVCRIYPAEINPFIRLRIEGKACPPEAWDAGRPLLYRDGAFVDPETIMLIDQARACGVSDVDAKRRLCSRLGIDVAAFANEGYAVFSPTRERLATILDALQTDAEDPDVSIWRIASNRRSTRDMLLSAGAGAVLVADVADPEFSYIGLFAAD